VYGLVAVKSVLSSPRQGHYLGNLAGLTL
jgi:hypothetical protein